MLIYPKLSLKYFDLILDFTYEPNRRSQIKHQAYLHLHFLLNSQLFLFLVLIVSFSSAKPEVIVDLTLNFTRFKYYNNLKFNISDHWPFFSLKSFKLFSQQTFDNYSGSTSNTLLTTYNTSTILHGSFLPFTKRPSFFFYFAFAWNLVFTKGEDL